MNGPRRSVPLRRALFALSLLAAALPLGAVVEEGVLVARVVDEATDRPLAGARVVVTSDEYADFREELTSARNGSVRLTVLDATTPYLFHVEAEGYQPIEARVKLTPGRTLRYTFRLSRLDGPSQSERAAYNQAVAFYNAGIAAQGSGDLAAAEENLRRAAETHPPLAAAHSALAELLAGRKRCDEALAPARRAHELEPGDTRTLGVLYECHRALGREEEARAALAALAAASGDPAAAVRLYNEAARTLGLGATEKARRLLEEALLLDPRLTAAHLALAKIALAEGRAAEAAAAAERALAIEPEDRQALGMRYQSYRSLGDEARADEALAAFVAAHPEAAAEALFRRAAERFQAGEAAAARTALETLLKRLPDHAEGHHLLGMIAAGEGDAEAARRHLGRFLALAPDHPDAVAARRLLEELE